jgi:predicted HicB family RNase H-like nuclease
MPSYKHQIAIDFQPIGAALEEPLALVDSPERRAEIQAYSRSVRYPLERAMFDVLSAVVTAINDAKTGVGARLEYAGGSLSLVLEAAPEEETQSTEPLLEGDLDEKVTIRLPRELKELIDRAAGMHGFSANSWYLHSLARQVSREMRDRKGPPFGPPRRRDNRGPRGRLQGYVGE